MVIYVKKFQTFNSLETIELGEKIGKLLSIGDVVLLTGDLSAGKTTITKGIGKALGIDRVINSPTFNIVKTYNGTKGKLYHLDLYRLDGINEDFDLEEYIETDALCVIEWPYQVEEILPDNYLLICLKRIDENNREIEVSGVGPRYEKVVGELK